MSRKFWIAVVIIIAAFAALFLLANFRIMSSQTADNSQAASARTEEWSGGENLSPSTTGLVVSGTTRLDLFLQAALVRAWSSQPDLGQVEALQVPPELNGLPFLQVEIKQQQVFWSPFYARSEIQVDAAYAFSGDVSFGEDEIAHFSSAAGRPDFALMGHYTVVDTSWGLISRAGYLDYLAGHTAGKILESLRQQAGLQ